MVSVPPQSCCDLCLEPLNWRDSIAERKRGDGRKSLNYLWNYLHHKNVREAVSSGVGCGGGGAGVSLPKLTFSLSVGEPEVYGEYNEKLVNLCEECCEELEKLDKLHQELEAVKNRIESQVGRIRDNRRRRIPDTSGRDSILGHGVTLNLEMSLGGSVVGKENIGRTLRFLGNLCDGLTTTSCSESKPTLSSSLDPLGGGGDGNNEYSMETHPATVSTIFPPDPRPDDLPPDSVIMNVEVEDAKVTKEEVLESNLVEDEGPDFEIQISAPRTIDESQLFLDLQDPAQDPLATDGETGSGRHKSLKRSSCRSKRPDSGVKSKNWKTCPICENRVSKSNFVSHMRLHTGAKPFRCETCHQTYNRKDHLIRHEKVHTGDKPYVCDLCHKRFTRQDAANAHKKRVHGKGKKA